MLSINDALELTSETLMFIPLIIFCFLPVTAHLKSSIKKVIIKAILAIIAIIAICLVFFYLFPLNLASFLSVLACVFIFFYLYQNEVNLSIYQLWFVFMTACLIGALSYLVYHMADIFINPSADAVDAYTSYYPFLIQVLFECVFIALIAYPTKKYLGWLLVNFKNDSVWLKISIFPIFFIMIFSVFVPYDNSKMYIGRAILLYFTAVILFILILAVTYIMFYLIVFNIVKNDKMKEKTFYLEMQAEQYRNLQDQVQITNRLRHDFRHHMTALTRMISNQEYEQALEFLKKYNIDTDKVVKQYCSSSAINGVLNHYYSSCLEKGITTHFGIELSETIGIEDVDFCVLLGNLLENAMYGCQTLPHKKNKIELKVCQTSPHIIVLSICNPFDGVVFKSEEDFLSSRHEGIGLGLKSVQNIAEKYNGFMKIDYSSNQFVVKVLLHN